MERRARCVLAALVLAVTVSASPRVGSVTAQEQRAGHLHACIFNHDILRTAPGKCRPHARAYPKNVAGRVRHAIYDSALIFGVPYSILLRIARCESALNPRARAGSHLGLFQFVPETFRRGSQQMRVDTGITARSIWNPRDASYVAGFLFAVGSAQSWTCETAG